MARRCSHCNHDSHNSRTYPNRGVRLFGVRLSDGSMQKSASTGNLAIFARSAAAVGGSPSLNPQDPPVADDVGSGYVSEGFNGGSASRERKKGVPWTEHEHKMFLLGLKKLGKGDWRGIARSYVISRTPTQVASHAQKYFIRHSATNRRKRRVSLFDIVADETTLADNLPPSSREQEVQSTSLLQVPQVSDEQADMKKDCSTTEMETGLLVPTATMKYSFPPPVYPVFFSPTVPLASDDHADINDNIEAEVEGAVPEPPVTMQFSYPPAYPGFFSPCFPCPNPYWTGYAEPATAFQSHEIVKPMAVYLKSPINVDKLFGISSLSLGACNGEAGPLVPGPKLVESSKRQSAFHHAGESSGSSRLDSSSSPIHAI